LYNIIFTDDEKYKLTYRPDNDIFNWQTKQRFFLCYFFILQEVFMSDFTVTDQAVEKLKEYLEQNNISSALRIALMQGG